MVAAPWQLVVSGPTYSGVTGAYNLDNVAFANAAITGAALFTSSARPSIFC